MLRIVNRLDLTNYFIIIPIISIGLAVFVLGFIAFQQTLLGKSFYFERLSQKFPPSSVEATRFKSIAQSLSQGKRTYTFRVKGAPPIAK